jgi:hypothetical protein
MLQESEQEAVSFFLPFSYSYKTHARFLSNLGKVSADSFKKFSFLHLFPQGIHWHVSCPPISALLIVAARIKDTACRKMSTVWIVCLAA